MPCRRAAHKFKAPQRVPAPAPMHATWEAQRCRSISAAAPHKQRRSRGGRAQVAVPTQNRCTSRCVDRCGERAASRRSTEVVRRQPHSLGSVLPHAVRGPLQPRGRVSRTSSAPRPAAPIGMEGKQRAVGDTSAHEPSSCPTHHRDQRATLAQALMGHMHEGRLLKLAVQGWAVWPPKVS